MPTAAAGAEGDFFDIARGRAVHGVLVEEAQKMGLAKTWASFYRIEAKELAQLTREVLREHEMAFGVYDRCGARTRAGTPCMRWPVRKTGRCPNHGGMSTGPRTKAGRDRIAKAQRRRWKAWRAAQGIKQRRRQVR
jgi:hypothetical protein